MVNLEWIIFTNDFLILLCHNININILGTFNEIIFTIYYNDTIVFFSKHK
jgi:hypothetical protein